MEESTTKYQSSRQISPSYGYELDVKNNNTQNLNLLIVVIVNSSAVIVMFYFEANSNGAH